MTEQTRSRRSKARRSPGQLHFREKSKLWEGVVYNPATGKREHIYSRDHEEAKRKLAALKAKIASGDLRRDSKMSVSAYLDYWLAEIAPARLRGSTLDNYTTVVRSYLNPPTSPGAKGRVFDGIALSALGPVDCQRVIRRLVDRGLSAGTQQKAKVVLHKALNDAVDLELIQRNPAAGLGKRIEEAQTKVSDALTDEEAAALIAAIRGHRFEAAFLLCLMCGLRRGEAAGLMWSDLDLDAGVAQIQRTLKWRSGVGLVVDPPKTKAGERSVRLPATVVEALRARRAAQLGESIVSGYVFTNSKGHPIHPPYLLRSYQSVTKRLGMGERRIHALRHSAATLLLEEGVDLSIISAMLGHSRYSVTADFYTEVRDKSLQVAADAMERAFGRKVV